MLVALVRLDKDWKLIALLDFARDRRPRHHSYLLHDIAGRYSEVELERANESKQKRFHPVRSESAL
jgi:hypothetical protein